MLRAERLLLPLLPGVTRESLLGHSARENEARDRQYQRAALLQARYCSLLIAIWDGRPTPHVAGSARVVEYRRRGLRIASDNDLVFEIRCSRTSNATAAQDASGVRVLGFSGSDVQTADDPLKCRTRCTHFWRARPPSTPIRAPRKSALLRMAGR